MRKRFLILFLLVSAVVYGQTPAGYIKANMRFKWTAGIFDSALHVPQYNGTPSGIRNGAWVGDGAVAVDTVNNLFYFRSSGAWHSTSSGSGWLITGNSGTTSSNFIGTTDNQPLSFRVNNTWAGRIYTNGSIFMGGNAGVNNIGELNAGFGQSALQNNTSGVGNTGSGVNSLGNNSLGSYNTGSGFNSLVNNSIGSYNTGIGLNSLKEIVVGGYNTGIGANVGNNAKQKVDAVHQILIGAETYGTRDSISVIGANFIKETIVRGKLIDSTLSAGAGTKAVRWNSSTGEFTYADTTAGNSVNLVFGGGSGASADTAVFTTSAIYGSFYNESDTLYVQSMRGVLQGSSPSVTYKVWYNTSVNDESGATALVTSGSSLTSTTSGTNVTSFNATMIPPGVWVWVKTSAVTTKPTYFSLTINAKR